MSNLDFDAMRFFLTRDDDLPNKAVAYHVTRKANTESILRDGLKANACQATHYGECRTEAVYLFAARVDAYDNNLRRFLFGSETDLAVLEVTIPHQDFDKLVYDGLFNMSATCDNDSYPTAVGFRGDIPANWIRVLG